MLFIGVVRGGIGESKPGEKNKLFLRLNVNKLPLAIGDRIEPGASMAGVNFKPEAIKTGCGDTKSDLVILRAIVMSTAEARRRAAEKGFVSTRSSRVRCMTVSTWP